MSIAERFWPKVKKGTPLECWPWLAGRFHFGHGAFALTHRKQDRSHRVAWTLTNGAIPDGMCVLHRCDNPPCCNPAHLFLGTKADNAKDRDAKLRQARGARSGHYTQPHRTARGTRAGRTKLTEVEVKNIRTLRNDFGVTLAALAQQFGISASQVHRIASGQAWSHL